MIASAMPRCQASSSLCDMAVRRVALTAGDLILFRTNTIAAQVTRWCTDGEGHNVSCT
jgi:hypothetical protein